MKYIFSKIFFFILVLLNFGVFSQIQAEKIKSYASIEAGFTRSVLSLELISDTNSEFVTNRGILLNIKMGFFLSQYISVHGGSSYLYISKLEPLNSYQSKASADLHMLSLGFSYLNDSYNFKITPEIRLFGNAQLNYNNGLDNSSVEKSFSDGSGYSISVNKNWNYDNKRSMGVKIIYFHDRLIGNQHRETKDSMRIQKSNFDDLRNNSIGLLFTVHLNATGE